jgi:hypothetical protein
MNNSIGIPFFFLIVNSSSNWLTGEEVVILGVSSLNFFHRFQSTEFQQNAKLKVQKIQQNWLPSQLSIILLSAIKYIEYSLLFESVARTKTTIALSQCLNTSKIPPPTTKKHPPTTNNDHVERHQIQQRNNRVSMKNGI